MDLGNFSVSLRVRDIAASLAFYQNLGFRVLMGDATQHWLILQNGHCTIGLFEGMIKQNMLCFNPGWDEKAGKLKHFTDIRHIQRGLKDRGVQLQTEADEQSSGPASLTVVDPDGNMILIDQHV